MFSGIVTIIRQFQTYVNDSQFDYQQVGAVEKAQRSVMATEGRFCASLGENGRAIHQAQEQPLYRKDPDDLIDRESLSL
jgi:hypothetical protein